MLHYFSRMPDIDIVHLLPRITAPTLVLAGDRDPIVPPVQACLIAKTVPNAELVLVDGAGHVLGAERSAQYRRTVTEWMHKIRTA